MYNNCCQGQGGTTIRWRVRRVRVVRTQSNLTSKADSWCHHVSLLPRLHSVLDQLGGPIRSGLVWSLLFSANQTLGCSLSLLLTSSHLPFLLNAHLPPTHSPFSRCAIVCPPSSHPTFPSCFPASSSHALARARATLSLPSHHFVQPTPTSPCLVLRRIPPALGTPSYTCARFGSLGNRIVDASL